MKPTAPIPKKPPPRPAIIRTSLITIFLIAAAVAFAFPWILQQKKAADQVKALSNAGFIGFALLAFEAEYGRFPDAHTAAEVAKRTGSTLAPPGPSANALLRQLIAAEMLNFETACYAKTAFTHKPDNKFSTPETALAPGELGYGYVLDGDTGLNSGTHHAAILLCAPLAMDGSTVSNMRFDPNPYNSRAVTLRVDLSARSHPINPRSGELLINGKPWLTTGEDTIWGTEITPHVATPEPR